MLLFCNPSKCILLFFSCISSHSLYRRDKTAEKRVSPFLALCTYLGNRSTIQALFAPFKKMADLEDTASIIHPKQVHHSYTSVILFSLFEGQLHIGRSKEYSSLFND